MLLSISNQRKRRSNNADLKPAGYGQINDRCSYTLHAASPVDWMHIAFLPLLDNRCEYRQDPVLEVRQSIVQNEFSLHGPDLNQYMNCVWALRWPLEISKSCPFPWYRTHLP